MSQTMIGGVPYSWDSFFGRDIPRTTRSHDGPTLPNGMKQRVAAIVPGTYQRMEALQDALWNGQRSADALMGLSNMLGAYDFGNLYPKRTYDTPGAPDDIPFPVFVHQFAELFEWGIRTYGRIPQEFRGPYARCGSLGQLPERMMTDGLSTLELELQLVTRKTTWGYDYSWVIINRMLVVAAPYLYLEERGLL